MEMGAPILARDQGAGRHRRRAPTQTIEMLKDYEFEQSSGRTLIVTRADRRLRLHHAVELAGNQIMCKVAPALAAGCTMVLKPSEIAPLNAHHLRGNPPRGRRAAGRVQPGERRRAHGRQAIASHPGVDMVSFTGSTRAGILVAKAAADTVKRVIRSSAVKPISTARSSTRRPRRIFVAI